MEVYPRVCGGTVVMHPLYHPLQGLSPRVRGNHCGWKNYSTPQRSIPACAGEPYCIHSRSVNVQVYPRVCGGTRWSSRQKQHRRGLSPRVRGNQVVPV